MIRFSVLHFMKKVTDYNKNASYDILRSEDTMNGWQGKGITWMDRFCSILVDVSESPHVYCSF